MPSFEQLGTLSDLDEALALQRNALELLPHEHPERSALLNTIAIYFHTRIEKHGTLPDLDEALAYERNALELRPHGDPDRATSLDNIVIYLHTHFQ